MHFIIFCQRPSPVLRFLDAASTNCARGRGLEKSMNGSKRAMTSDGGLPREGESREDFSVRPSRHISLRMLPLVVCGFPQTLHMLRSLGNFSPLSNEAVLRRPTRVLHKCLNLYQVKNMVEALSKLWFYSA